MNPQTQNFPSGPLPQYLSTYLQQPLTSLTSPVHVVEIEGIQDTKQMDTCGQNGKHMEYLVRTAPDIKATWTKLFREPRAIHKGADEDQSTLGIVIGEASLLVEVLGRE